MGAMSVLRDDDLITSAHRGHGHCHACGASMAKTEDERKAHNHKIIYGRAHDGQLHHGAPFYLHVEASARRFLALRRRFSRP